MREIKFRYVCKDVTGELFTFIVSIEDLERAKLNVNTYGRIETIEARNEYTSLKDKNGCVDVYEGDIIDKKGDIKGNVYENHQGKTDLVIQGFGTKTWYSTYQKAMDRGCKNA